MHTLIMKLLGLNTLVTELNSLKNEVLVLESETKELKKANADLELVVADLETKVNDIEVPDMDGYVAHTDLDDNIETYLNNYDYVTKDYLESEIEDKVSEALDDADIDSKIEGAIEDLDIEEKVRDLFNDASPAPMSEQAIKDEIQKSIAEVFSKVYDLLKRQ